MILLSVTIEVRAKYVNVFSEEKIEIAQVDQIFS